MQYAALRSTAAAATSKRADPRSAERAFGSFPHVVAGAAGARHAAVAGADLHAGRHAGLEDHAVVNRQTLGTALPCTLCPIEKSANPLGKIALHTLPCTPCSIDT